jgi:hypothetical protein
MLGVVIALCLAQATAQIAPTGIPAADFAWLENTTAAFLSGCELRGVGNVSIFTPDASSSYGAQWTRDFAMALTSAPRAFPRGTNVSAAVEYTLSRITPQGMVPDRVGASGEPIFAPGPPGRWPIALAWDNMPYAMLLLTAYVRQSGDAGFFCAWEPAARRALDFVPLRGGLAFNDPAAPNTSFGFEDSVVLPGRQLTVSLLLFDAARQAAALARTSRCGDAAHYDALAAGVASAVDDLYYPASFLFNASDTLETVPDVFGSAYLVTLGLSSAARRAGVAQWLAAQWRSTASEAENLSRTTTVFQSGQVRHLPFPRTWARCWLNDCPEAGTYQNGAFWATPLAWVLPALEAHGFSAEATAIARAAVASFQSGGVMECVNADLLYHGVRDYVASATNLLGAVAPSP